MTQIYPSLLFTGLCPAEISTGKGKEQKESVYKEHQEY